MPEWGHERTWLNAPHISALQQPPHVHSRGPKPCKLPCSHVSLRDGERTEGKELGDERMKGGS